MHRRLKALPPERAIHVVIGAALSAIGIAMGSTSAMAQEAAADSPSTPQPLQRVEITGSNIRRADAETPSPVQVISADDLKKSGYTTLAQVLQNITANGQGTLANTSPLSFAAGASGIALRGLDTASTLVLIDGHRMAPYPLPDNAQFAFVDISNIPFDAIERVEILKDGASAVYGSDAIAGVVNVILKKNFVGTKVNAEASGTTEGGGAAAHASVIYGAGDFAADGYNAYASLEYRHQDAISFNQRAGDGDWASLNQSAIGGVNKTPGVIGNNPFPVTSSPYLLAPGAPLTAALFAPGASCSATQLNSAAGCPSPILNQLQPETQNINLLASFSKNLGKDWRLDVKASLFDSQSTQVFGTTAFPQAYVQGSTGGLAVSRIMPPTLVGPPSMAVTVPATYPGNTLGVAANVFGLIPGAPLFENQIETRAQRLVADLGGSIGAWDVSASLGYTKLGTNQDIQGSLNIPALNAAFNRPANPFNIYGSNSAADMAAIFPNTSAYDTSLLDFAELHASRSLMALAGGDLGFSVGASFIHRDLESPAPTLVAEGVVAGNNAFSSGAQNDGSVYMELAAPVLKSLELDASARFDHIDTTGNASTGKLGFKWSPVDQFALRGSASNGFRAPNPSEAGNAGAAAVAQSTYDPVYCPGGLQANGNPPKGAVINLNGLNLCNFLPVGLGASNPNLQPERSTSFTLGMILEPIKGWSSTIDAYKITVRDQIILPALDYQSAVPVRSTTAVNATCSDGTASGTEPCPGPVYPVLYYPNNYINANSTMTSGIELGSRYKFKLGDYGSLKTELDWSHTFSYVYTAGGTSYQLVGTHGPIVISNDTGNPQDRVQMSFTWDKGPWEVATAFNWISSYSLLDSSIGFDSCALGATGNGWFSGVNTPLQGCTVKSFLDIDLTAHYIINKQWSIHGAITNLFNQAPPLDIGTYGSVLPYNPSLHQVGAVGRSISLGATFVY